MFFKKKSNTSSCPKCDSSVSTSYTFCPYCGSQMISKEDEQEQFGMLGQTDSIQEQNQNDLINNLISNLMKNMDLPNMLNQSKVENMPNGIKIKFGIPKQQPKVTKTKAKVITEEQATRMANLPRASAKTQVRRLSDKVVYQLATTGIDSVQDIFVSKLESGYEIKAIGKNKVYVNSLPVNLPLKGYAINEKGITVEFGLE